ncbi:hypothetical protein EVAR_8548_1 [Eumeta japonica]|uniref:Uncharacterized protein n=1 Tax=Eumeta variegata TaxID=151549 RepID=A0A4C1TXF3_EUMVA|nr:hypothetical protein EVAR_8548_1 [Eumeta japonica]
MPRTSHNEVILYTLFPKNELLKCTQNTKRKSSRIDTRIAATPVRSKGTFTKAVRVVKIRFAAEGPVRRGPRDRAEFAARERNLSRGGLLKGSNIGYRVGLLCLSLGGIENSLIDQYSAVLRPRIREPFSFARYRYGGNRRSCEHRNIGADIVHEPDRDAPDRRVDVDDSVDAHRRPINGDPSPVEWAFNGRIFNSSAETITPIMNEY